MKIRSDDPLAMKTFIISIHNKANEIKASPDAPSKIKNYTVSDLREIDSLLEEEMFCYDFNVVPLNFCRWKRCLKPLLQSRTTSLKPKRIPSRTRG